MVKKQSIARFLCAYCLTRQLYYHPFLKVILNVSLICFFSRFRADKCMKKIVAWYIVEENIRITATFKFYLRLLLLMHDRMLYLLWQVSLELCHESMVVFL